MIAHKQYKGFFCPTRSKFLIIISYPFAVFFLYLFCSLVIGTVRGIKNSDNYKYPSSKYKKSIKKGFFFDTIEYTER
jgi:hypothetical protein